MLGALLKKELRQLLPWLLLLAFIELAFLLLAFVVDPPDEFEWVRNTAILESSAAGVRSVWLLIWSLTFAYAGFPREYDDRTLPFLLSLPVGRAKLFLSKVLAAGGLLTLSLVYDELVGWLMSTANTTSFGARYFRADFALLNLALSVLLAWVLLGYSLFLAIFRRLGLLVCVVFWSLLAYVDRAWPALRGLDPLKLLHLDFHGTVPQVPWLALAIHAGLATGFACISALVWVGPVERWAGNLSQFVARPWMRWAFAIGVIASVLAVALVVADHDEASDDALPARFGVVLSEVGAEASLATKHYAFRYREPFKTRVERLAARADGSFERVAALVGASRDGEVISVNLLKSSGSHAGSATWNAIRMNLVDAYDDDHLLNTLAHETSHVLALRVSDRRTDAHAPTFRFFDEGLAEHVALEVVPAPARVEGRFLEAALARARSRVDFAALVDFPKFAGEFGEATIYPLGFTWVRALVAVCGEDAPRRVLRALGREGAPRDLGGQALIQDTLQHVRCELGEVNARWEKELAERALTRKDALARIPVLSGGPLRLDEEIIVRVEIEGKAPEDASYRLHVRAKSEQPLEDQFTIEPEKASEGSLTFSVPEVYAERGTLDFQFSMGWLEDGVFLEHYQPWRTAPLPP